MGKVLLKNSIKNESIVNLPLIELFPPEFHPFNVHDDEAMHRLVNSISQYGVREPGIVRPRADGGYELLCGNRRKRACEISGIPTMPVIIRDLDDASAAITMIDSNLQQRERILPSEKAWAYRLKMEALNHNGIKGEMHSVDILVEQTGESRNQIFRFIRLTELVNALLDKVDMKRLAFNPAVELSYLSVIEQAAVASVMEKYDVKPSLSQAQRLKQMKQAGTLTIDIIDRTLSEIKQTSKNEMMGALYFKKYFPNNYSLKQMESVIVELLTAWQNSELV